MRVLTYMYVQRRVAERLVELVQKVENRVDFGSRVVPLCRVPPVVAHAGVL